MSQTEWIDIGGVSAPLYDESELTERTQHWYTLFKDREDFYEFLLEYEDTADEVTSSEYAMRAAFRLDLEED